MKDSRHIHSISTSKYVGFFSKFNNFQSIFVCFHSKALTKWKIGLRKHAFRKKNIYIFKTTRFTWEWKLEIKSSFPCFCVNEFGSFEFFFFFISFVYVGYINLNAFEKRRSCLARTFHFQHKKSHSFLFWPILLAIHREINGQTFQIKWEKTKNNAAKT